MLLLTAIVLASVGGHLQTDTVVSRPVVALFTYRAFDARSIDWASSPSAVLYEDRTFIYLVQDSTETPSFATSRLSASEFASFLDSLALVPAFFELGDWYSNLPSNYEPPGYAVWAWDGSQGKRVYLEGLLDSTARLFMPKSADLPPRTPKAFVNAARRLMDLRPQNASAWYPGHFEIRLSEDSLAGPADESWPTGWPAFDGPGITVDRRGDHHVPLDQAQVAEYLRCCVHALFDLGGRQWRGSVRPVFPGDQFWHP